MAERLPYSGTPLPTGLPGVGGSTVEVIILPGFNTVVAAQTFGPTVDAVDAIPPNPTPPVGSNPQIPTTEVVEPAFGVPPIASGTLSQKLDRVPPCDQINGLVGAFYDCGIRFKEYTVCENGIPNTVFLWTLEYSVG
jgi:hypothetical protein